MMKHFQLLCSILAVNNNCIYVQELSVKLVDGLSPCVIRTVEISVVCGYIAIKMQLTRIRRIDVQRIRLLKTRHLKIPREMLTDILGFSTYGLKMKVSPNLQMTITWRKIRRIISINISYIALLCWSLLPSNIQEK